MMKTLQVEITQWEGTATYKHEGRAFDAFRIKSLKNQTFEVVAINKGIPYRTISKRAKFEEGNVSITFGKEKVVVGTYIEISV